jgi:hypothetical protein
MALTGFQQWVNQQPPPGKAGDWAGANIRAFVNGPNNGYVSDGTVIAGQFAWANPATGVASATQAAGSLLGFVQSEDQALITNFLGFNNTTITLGLPVVLVSQGDVWCNFAAAAAAGAQVYATSGTGAASTTSGGNYSTPWYVVQAVPAAASFTGVIAASVNGVGELTVSALTGTLAIGQFVTGVGVPANLQITGWAGISGTYGAAGVYTVSNATAVSSVAMTANAGTVTKISTWQQ